MTYSFETKEGRIDAFIPFAYYNDNATVYQPGDRSYETKLYNNENGDLVFDYKGEEIHFKNFIKTSMKEIKQKIERQEHIGTDDFIRAIICDGMHNVRFGVDIHVPDTVIPEIGVNVCGGNRKRCKCELVEEHPYLPHASYKIKIKAVESEGYSYSDDYYACDFKVLLCSGSYEVLESVDDGKTAEEHVIEYFRKITADDMFEFKMKG